MVGINFGLRHLLGILVGINFGRLKTKNIYRITEIFESMKYVLINIVFCTDVMSYIILQWIWKILNLLFCGNSKLLGFLLNYSRRLVASLFFIVDNRFFQELSVVLLVFSWSYLSSFRILLLSPFAYFRWSSSPVVMDQFIVRTPRLKPSLPVPSRSDQDLPDPNSFDDFKIAFEANEAVKSALSLSSSETIA